ncbi:uncharacterized protein [Anabrus simplex]|uniref:uncharacterized protein n=1 Tax=Anabrus simplex TaxID=316456 RepID=UPI0035A2B2C9
MLPVAGALAVLMVIGKATSKYCDGGHTCVPPKECCAQDCCFVYTSQGYRPPAAATTNLLSLVFWNHWYLWFLLFLLVASCIGGCGLWRRRHSLVPCCCWRRDSSSTCSHHGDDQSSEQDSSGSCCAPPHYSRCSSFHHAPPPYAEVTSKPDLYPLVISYGGNDQGKGASGGSYLMVQYFRNYIVRPVGSVSATSTADSLSSGFLCSAANEANTIIPPPYSCAGSLDEFSAITPLPSLAQQSAIVPAPCSQSFVSATALSTTGSDVSSLAGVGTPGSPPRATSPTLEIRELLDKIQQLPFQEGGNSNGNSKMRASRRRLYMPLTLGAVGRRWLSRSAPTTPCTHLPPSAIAPPRPASSTHGKEDGSPLLAEHVSDDEPETDDHV